MACITLGPSERRDWLRLFRTENVSAIAFNQLLRRYGTAGQAIEAAPGLAERGGKRNLALPSQTAIEDEIATTRKMGGDLIAKCEPHYPQTLASLEDAPPLISYLGRQELLQKPAMAIIGARDASLKGQKIAEALAYGLGRADVMVVSGLARGIDAAAHRGALATGTTAVVAGGVDVIYPEENRELYARIVEDGCIVSDQALGQEPYVKVFPRRHRVITGLSLGLLVVEAGPQSSCLVTAADARLQKREVFAVPGSPLDPRWDGTHYLIRKGARPIETSQDITDRLRELLMPERDAAFDQETFANDTDPDLPVARVIIHEFLGNEAISLDDLVRHLALPRPAIATVLLELELAGRIERRTGDRVLLAAEDRETAVHMRAAAV